MYFFADIYHFLQKNTNLEANLSNDLLMIMNASLKNLHCADCQAINGDTCLIGKIEKQWVDKLQERKHLNTFRKGSLIFHEGNYPVGLYAIFSGKVKIFKTSEVGKEYILRLAKDGEILGYRSILTNEKYEVSAEALEDTQLCFIPTESFSNALRSSTRLSIGVMDLLAEDLKRTEEKLTDMAQKTVKERTAEMVLMLRRFYGLEEDGATINATLSREELANLVGTATETLIRMLSEFKDNKVLDLKGKKITILNLRLLQDLANVYD